MTSVSARNNPRGFEPAQSLGGGQFFQTRRYKVSADNGAAIFPGDLVMLGPQGGVQGWTDASAIGAMDPALGVVKALYDTNGKPLTFSQPTNGPFLDASTEGYAEVYDNPDAVFVANASASFATSNLGHFAALTVGVDNSAAGISGQGVTLGTTASSVGGHPFMVMGLAEADGFPDQEAAGARNNDVYVKITDHVYRRHVNIVGSDA